ncbi:hypothetical protein RRG08_054961 [Elysia crispata]|uniref:Uncharacterized protein n=1 Tax=Elysia crispata TaxID=231223 RepID=A0AAE1AS34_9GAST|nr:hypothetical protein RRG08_054961 [Elysia crispata]
MSQRQPIKQVEILSNKPWSMALNLYLFSLSIRRCYNQVCGDRIDSVQKLATKIVNREEPIKIEGDKEKKHQRWAEMGRDGQSRAESGSQEQLY